MWGFFFFFFSTSLFMIMASHLQYTVPVGSCANCMQPLNHNRPYGYSRDIEKENWWSESIFSSNSLIGKYTKLFGHVGDLSFPVTIPAVYLFLPKQRQSSLSQCAHTYPPV